MSAVPKSLDRTKIITCMPANTAVNNILIHDLLLYNMPLINITYVSFTNSDTCIDTKPKSRESLAP